MTIQTSQNCCVVSVDLAGFSDIQRSIEKVFGVAGAALISQRLAAIIDHGLERIQTERSRALIKDTGDGALLFFPTAIQAFSFGEEVHQYAGEISKDASALGTKWDFRVGIAYGEILYDETTGTYSGHVISKATRIETSAPIAGISVDEQTYAALPPIARARFSGAKVIKGKRDEAFKVHNYLPDFKSTAKSVIDDLVPTPVTEAIKTPPTSTPVNIGVRLEKQTTQPPPSVNVERFEGDGKKSRSPRFLGFGALAAVILVAVFLLTQNLFSGTKDRQLLTEFTSHVDSMADGWTDEEEKQGVEYLDALLPKTEMHQESEFKESLIWFVDAISSSRRVDDMNVDQVYEAYKEILNGEPESALSLTKYYGRRVVVQNQTSRPEVALDHFQGLESRAIALGFPEVPTAYRLIWKAEETRGASLPEVRGLIEGATNFDDLDQAIFLATLFRYTNPESWQKQTTALGRTLATKSQATLSTYRQNFLSGFDIDNPAVFDAFVRGELENPHPENFALAIIEGESADYTIE